MYNLLIAIGDVSLFLPATFDTPLPPRPPQPPSPQSPTSQFPLTQFQLIVVVR